MYGEPLAYRIIHEDTRYAADLFRPVYERTNGVDGWVVTPVSPLSMAGNHSLVLKYKKVYEQIKRPNVLLCLPALNDRLPDIEELVYAGVPLNIANIYSEKHYTAVTNACLAGVERRLEARYKPGVSTFITINIYRLIKALEQKADSSIAIALAVAMAQKIYRRLREQLNSPEWNKIFSMGVSPFRIIWTYCDDDRVPEVYCDLYRSLIAPYTVISLPGDLIRKIIAHPVEMMPMLLDSEECDQVLIDSHQAGLNIEAEADRLQHDYIGWLSKEWAILLENFARKSATVTRMETLE